ncbi:MAG: hypothetical protein K5989_04980 [Lachnospiraceae bacterium]|nr:hypothetical protein [Lachnospiraceae bacterium]
MDIMSSITQNLGLVEKAMIEVWDLRDRKLTVKDAVKVAGGEGGGAGGGIGGGAFDLKDMAKNVGSSKMNMGVLYEYMKDLGGYGADEEMGLEALAQLFHSQASRKYFTVQFNPSTLKLSGHNGGLVKKLDFNNGDSKGKKFSKSASFEKGDTDISLSVSLLFDSVVNSDAFSGDMMTFNATGLVQKGVKLIKGKQVPNVQKRVEGFIGALRSRYTRLLTFIWGDFAYSGTLKSVNAAYTMFDMYGRPIRGTVNLKITCADASSTANSLEVWRERYRKAFQNGSESFVKKTQKLGGLLKL